MDKGKVSATLLTDYSKVFDCLLHKIIIAKLNAYGFSLSVIKLKPIYCKLDQAYSSWEEIRVTQGPILGPILFNIFSK